MDDKINNVFFNIKRAENFLFTIISIYAKNMHTLVELSATVRQKVSVTPAAQEGQIQPDHL